MSANEKWPEPERSAYIDKWGDTAECFDVFDHENKGELVARYFNEEYAKRAVAEHNACAGMSDPAKEIQSMREQAEMFRYLCKVTHADSPAELKDHHCFMGIDGKTHWGKTFEEAVRKAMNHDKGVTP